jgi:hypothetical protein
MMRLRNTLFLRDGGPKEPFWCPECLGQYNAWQNISENLFCYRGFHKYVVFNDDVSAIYVFVKQICAGGGGSSGSFLSRSREFGYSFPTQKDTNNVQEDELRMEAFTLLSSRTQARLFPLKARGGGSQLSLSLST